MAFVGPGLPGTDLSVSHWSFVELCLGVVPGSGVSHTGDWLAEQVRQALSNASIPMTSVQSFHTDNASNYLLASRGLGFQLPCAVHTLHPGPPHTLGRSSYFPLCAPGCTAGPNSAIWCGC